ncbi:MAG: lytic murein transglycosylase [Pseudomonadota bacterium]
MSRLPFRNTSAAVLATLLLLSGCAQNPVQAPVTPPLPTTSSPAESETPVFSNQEEFQQCLDSLRPAALKTGISETIWQQYTAKLSPDMSLLPRLNKQPEFSQPIWDYLAGLVDDERVDLAKAKMAGYDKELTQISAQYGVPREAIVAIWGIESNFGQNAGRLPLLRSLSTLSCLGRRQAFFRGEFFATLRILQAGDFSEDRLKGSWAGAFGQTQFMPSTFERVAVDFDGDGRRDLIDNTADALASTANYLKRANWVTGQPWGIEVKLPEGFDAAGENRRNKRSLSVWMQRGVMRVDGMPLVVTPATAVTPTAETTAEPTPETAATTPPVANNPTITADTLAGLLLPSGVQGPAFLVMRNFDAFYSYNAAESYGLAIAHLADRIAGGGDFVTPWPTDDLALSRSQRRELQQLLLERGHDIGEVDGRLGERSRSAIRIEQEKLGQPVTGRGGMKVLLALRGQ